MRFIICQHILLIGMCCVCTMRSFPNSDIFYGYIHKFLSYLYFFVVHNYCIYMCVLV